MSSLDIYIWPAGDVWPEDWGAQRCYRCHFMGAAGNHLHQSCPRRVSGGAAHTHLHDVRLLCVGPDVFKSTSINHLNTRIDNDLLFWHQIESARHKFMRRATKTHLLCVLPPPTHVWHFIVSLDSGDTSAACFSWFMSCVWHICLSKEKKNKQKKSFSWFLATCTPPTSKTPSCLTRPHP